MGIEGCFGTARLDVGRASLHCGDGSSVSVGMTVRVRDIGIAAKARHLILRAVTGHTTPAACRIHVAGPELAGTL